MKTGTIPFPRQFTVGDAGIDCRAVKRALAKATDGPHGMNIKTNAFAKTAGQVLADYKQTKGLLHDPAFTLQAHDALQDDNAYDELGASLMNREYAAIVSAGQRSAIVTAYRTMISLHARYGYFQIRPVPLSTKPYPPPGVYVKTDCSGSIILAAYWVDLPDPSGLNFSGQGNTGSFLAHCHHITQAQAQPADLVVYRRNQYDTYGHHAVIILARLPNGDFNVGSDGHQGAPEEITHSEELRRQAALGYPDAVFLRWLPAT